jgi:hypothetical protein
MPESRMQRLDAFIENYENWASVNDFLDPSPYKFELTSKSSECQTSTARISIFSNNMHVAMLFAIFRTRVPPTMSQPAQVRVSNRRRMKHTSVPMANSVVVKILRA